MNAGALSNPGFSLPSLSGAGQSISSTAKTVVSIGSQALTAAGQVGVPGLILGAGLDVFSPISDSIWEENNPEFAKLTAEEQRAFKSQAYVDAAMNPLDTLKYGFQGVSQSWGEIINGGNTEETQTVAPQALKASSSKDVAQLQEQLKVTKDPEKRLELLTKFFATVEGKKLLTARGLPSVDELGKQIQEQLKSGKSAKEIFKHYLGTSISSSDDDDGVPVIESTSSEPFYASLEQEMSTGGGPPEPPKEPIDWKKLLKTILDYAAVAAFIGVPVGGVFMGGKFVGENRFGFQQLRNDKDQLVFEKDGKTPIKDLSKPFMENKSQLINKKSQELLVAKRAEAKARIQTTINVLLTDEPSGYVQKELDNIYGEITNTSNIRFMQYYTRLIVALTKVHNKEKLEAGTASNQLVITTAVGNNVDLVGNTQSVEELKQAYESLKQQ